MNLRYGPRRHSQRWRIILLICATLFLILLIVYQQGWQSSEILTDLRRDIMPFVPAQIPQLSVQQVNKSESDADTVVMVDSQVVEKPQSDAYTADLYSSTGKDEIPWPNVAGRTKIVTYTVQSGDTLWSIADQFQLDLNTLRWSNPELEQSPDILPVGMELRILPVNGVYHLIDAGDTIEAIAEQYGVAPADIANYPPNALFSPFDLEAIEGVIVPYGRKDVSPPPPSLAAEFALAWPVVGEVIDEFRSGHPAVDIGVPYGSPIYAADSGTITYAGWAQDGDGYTIIIDHEDGRRTFYKHLKGTLLQADNFVTRGTPIAEAGSTGHTIGPHVHFELQVGDEWVDPRLYLSGTSQ